MIWKPVMIPAWYHLLCLFSVKTVVFLQLTIWPIFLIFLNTVLPIFTFLLVTMLLISTFYWTQCYPCSLFHAFNISLPSFTFYCFQCYRFFFFLVAMLPVSNNTHFHFFTGHNGHNVTYFLFYHFNYLHSHLSLCSWFSISGSNNANICDGNIV